MGFGASTVIFGFQGGGAPCDDAEWTLVNNDDTELDSGSIGCGDSVTIVAPDATVTVLSNAFTTVPSGDTLDINLTDENDGAIELFGVISPNQIFIANTPYEINGILSGGITPGATTPYNQVIENTGGNPVGTAANPSVVADSNVENSDASYSDTVEAEGTLVLPDTDIDVNGNNEGAIPSVQTVDIQVTDGVNPVTPNDVTVSGNTVTIEVPAAVAPVGATLMKTGQKTSYRTGDDGDLQEGRAVNFFTLASNNPFGNTNRFTDELGGSTYTNNIVIDWSTFDGTTVLGWYRVENGTNINWNDAIDGALAVSIGSFTTGWRLPNRLEMVNIIDNGTSANRILAGFPMFLGGNNFFWTSTTARYSTTGAFFLTNNTGAITITTKTTSTGHRYIPCRTFTWNGSSLT